VELPLGVTARELIEEHAGGVWKGRKAKAVVPGGISMGFLSTKNWIRSWTLQVREKSVASDWVRRRSLLLMIRPAWWMCCSTAVASCHTNPAVSARRAVKALRG
jgi:hypothetical protein